MSTDDWTQVPLTDWALSLASALRHRVVGKSVGISFHQCGDSGTWGLVLSPCVLDGPDGTRIADVIDHLALEELPAVFEGPPPAVKELEDFWQILGVFAGRIFNVYICREADLSDPATAGRKNADGTITWYSAEPEGPTA